MIKKIFDNYMLLVLFFLEYVYVIFYFFFFFELSFFVNEVCYD